MPKRRQTLKKTSHFRRVWSESVALGHGPAPGHVPGRSGTKGGGTGAVPQLVDGVFYFIFFGFSAARARARFREVVLHGTNDVENEFRVSEVYLGVRGSSRFVAESDLAFFGLAGPVTTPGWRGLYFLGHMVSPDIQGLGLSDKLLEHYKREVGEMALGILDGKPFDSPVHEGILLTCMLELLPYDDSDKSEFSEERFHSY